MAQEQLKTTPEVQALLDRARKANLTGKYNQAALLYDQALSKARDLKDRKGEADAIAEKMGIKDRKGEADALYKIGVIYSKTGQKQKALEFYNQALPLYRETGDKQWEANTLYNLGNLYSDTGQPQKAQESVNQALALDRAL